MFTKDVEKIKEKLRDSKITGKNAKDGLTKLRVYVLTQLEGHYDLINQLLKDTEMKTEVFFTKDGRDFPERLREDLMKLIDKAEKEVKI
jgi:hypothetical protein